MFFKYQQFVNTNYNQYYLSVKIYLNKQKLKPQIICGFFMKVNIIIL